MRIAQINGSVFGSTGNIMFGIADLLKEQGHETVCFAPVTTTNRYSEPDHDYIKIGRFLTRRADVLFDRVTGCAGGAAVFATKKLIRALEDFDPDVVHLHVMHEGYVNLRMLFGYIRRKGVRLVWTMHDCWAFTGHCCHYDMIGCGKWETGCFGCPLYRGYPPSLFDNSRRIYKFKKELFGSLPDMTIVTPSEWLARQIRRSFLKERRTVVINNGIDLDIFRPVDSDFREKHGLDGKNTVLGVAFGWDEKKGLDVFAELSQKLPDDFRIVLVGTDDNVDRRLPEGIISIHRTADRRELAQIYTAADIFVNPTREENFPTVNMEALACGTPVITFDTGGSPEIADKSCGSVIPKNDVGALEKEILRVCRDKPYPGENCLTRARRFDIKERLKEYPELYTSL